MTPQERAAMQRRANGGGLLDWATTTGNAIGNWWDVQHPMDKLALGTAPIPILGDVTGLAADARMFIQEPESRTPLNFGLSALGALPFVPAMSATVRGYGQHGDDVADALKGYDNNVVSRNGDPIPDEGLLGMPKAPQDDALALAQKNAALSIEDGGLGLPQNNTAMDRASAMGFDVDEEIYHASTHDIDAFDLSKANPEGDMGAGIYTTSSAEDASSNYSDLSGADLTQRIESRADSIANEMDGLDTDEMLELSSQYGLTFDPNDVTYPDELPRLMAERELYGKRPNISPLYGRSDNPLLLGDEQSLLSYELPEVDYKDYLDEVGGDIDEAMELANDARYDGEPEGSLVDLMDSLRNNNYDANTSQSIGLLNEVAYDGEGILSNDAMDILRSDYNLLDVYDDSGSVAGTELIREAFEGAGFDSIIDSGVNAKWGDASGRANMMEGMDDETIHRIFFKPNQLRSKFAAFDPMRRESANLLAGIGGIGLTGLLGYNMQDEGPQGLY